MLNSEAKMVMPGKVDKLLISIISNLNIVKWTIEHKKEPTGEVDQVLNLLQNILKKYKK
jgi:hypothetical protein